MAKTNQAHVIPSWSSMYVYTVHVKNSCSSAEKIARSQQSFRTFELEEKPHSARFVWDGIGRRRPWGCRLHRDASCHPRGAEKLRKLLLAIETADTLDQLGRFPGWRRHPLKGDLKGFWSLTVTGNWRLIFHYDEETNTASEIDLIDYH
jgi:toxin HigB-1